MNCFAVEPELVGEQPRGLVALAVVGIAEIERAPRQAVEAQHEPVRPAVPHPVVVDVARERPDVAGIVVEAVDVRSARHPPQSARDGRRRVERARRRARRILRIERHDENAIAPAARSSRERVAIAELP